MGTATHRHGSSGVARAESLAGVRGSACRALGACAGNAGLLHCPPCTSPSKRSAEPQAHPILAGPMGLTLQCRSGRVCCRGAGSSAEMGGETKTALWQGMVLLQSCRLSIWGCHSPGKPTLPVAVPVTSGKVVSFYTDLGALPLSPKQIPLIECLINT